MSKSSKPFNALLPLPNKVKHTLKHSTQSCAVLTARFTHDPTGAYVLTGGADGVIRLWNAHSGNAIHSYSGGHAQLVSDVAVARDHAHFVSCGERALVWWDVAAGAVARRLPGHEQRINCVSLNDDASVAASGSYDATVRLWDMRTTSRAPIQVLDEAKDSVTCVYIQNYEILTGSVDGHVRLYDIRKGTLTVDPMNQPVVHVRYSGDGHCLLVNTLDDTMRLLDKDNGGVLSSYRGHINHSYKIQGLLTKTDAFAASGSEDGAIYFWDLVDGRLVHVIQGKHTQVVSAMDYSPATDRNAMISASMDGVIHIWE